jgi:hypothetical protein
MAETTTTTGRLFATSATRSATAQMRSVFFKELPPYFWTTKDTEYCLQGDASDAVCPVYVLRDRAE